VFLKEKGLKIRTAIITKNFLDNFKKTDPEHWKDYHKKFNHM